MPLHGQWWPAKEHHSRTLNEATRNKVLLISEGGEPRTLDPHAGQSLPEYHIILGLIEGLVGCHPTDRSKEVPAMADRWEHNDNYSVWTFHIGEDRKWSNGCLLYTSDAADE